MGVFGHPMLLAFLTCILALGIYSIKIGSGSLSSSASLSKTVVISVSKNKGIVTAGPTVTTQTPAPITTPITTVPKNTSGSYIQTGIGCGTMLLKSGEVVMIQSNNFNATTNATYPNKDSCIWKFIGKECTLSAECPCLDIPPSFKCIEDYLKIIDPPFYYQKFCGSTQPQGVYRASTEALILRFRSNNSDVGKGFLCYIQCTYPGKAEQLTPNSTTICPNFTIYNKRK